MSEFVEGDQDIEVTDLDSDGDLDILFVMNRAGSRLSQAGYFLNNNSCFYLIVY